MSVAILPLLVVFAILVSGCVANPSSNAAIDASYKCRQKCMQLVPANIDFSSGPCLDDNLMEDWVCDMAHDPRQPVDDIKTNQCPSFGTKANHFIEVDENCRLIRAV